MSTNSDTPEHLLAEVMKAGTVTTSSSPKQKLVVMLPALNESKTISTVLGRVPRSVVGFDEVQVIVVDDGSTDDTAKRARHAGATVVSHAENMGVGAAFHTGLRTALQAGATMIVNIDSDGQFNPLDIPTLITPIMEDQADFVTATRFAVPELVPDMPATKLWGNKMMTRIINFLTKKKFTDVSCGFRAYSREAALRLTLFGHFTYTQETFIDLAFKNIRMREVPLKIRGEREYGRSRVASNLWRYGIKAATIIFRAARDYKPHYFFGVPGLALFSTGVATGIFLVQHYVRTGQTSPFRSLIQLSSVLIIVGFLLVFLSLLADMLHRNRVVADEAVYHARKASYGGENNT